MRQLLLLCLLLSGIATAETYRWTDSAGRTQITDTPPPKGATKLSTTSTAPAPATAPAGGSELPFAVRRAAESFPVVLYTTPECAECKAARELLSGRGVPFTEKTVKSAEEAEELKQLVGDAFVPSIKVGRQKFRGFDAGSWDNLLDLAGYPKGASRAGPPAGNAQK